MSDDKPTPEPDATTPGDVTPHDRSRSPKPGEPADATKPADGAPYDKAADPAQQPS